MKTLDVDARRYAWCRGQGVWILGLPVATFVEDMHGALEDGQEGIVRFATREIGEGCAVALAIMLFYRRPIPAPAMRASWALDSLGTHELAPLCRELVRSDHRTPPGELVVTATALVAAVHDLVSQVPDVLTPDGYFPALSIARGWLNLLQLVDEEGFLPREWTPG